MNKFYPRLYVTLSFALFVFFTPIFSASAVENNNLAKRSMERLRQGNDRYVNSTTVCHDDWSAKRTAVLQSQTPFAVIVSCSDSRVPPEIIFDQTLGDLFVVRVAGNVVDDFAIGSVEYGVSVLGANLVLVLGHSNCGAVDGALKGLKFDNHIQSVLNEIQPAIDATKGDTRDRLKKAIYANVKNVENRLRTSKPVLATLLERGKVGISGGYYDLESGKVEFFD